MFRILKDRLVQRICHTLVVWSSGTALQCVLHIYILRIRRHASLCGGEGQPDFFDNRQGLLVFIGYGNDGGKQPCLAVIICILESKILLFGNFI